MGNVPGGGKGDGKGGKDGKDKPDPKKKRYEPPQPYGRNKKKVKKGSVDLLGKVPSVLPNTKCRLRYLRHERLKVGGQSMLGAMVGLVVWDKNIIEHCTTTTVNGVYVLVVTRGIFL